MKKLLYLFLIILVTAQIITPMNPINPDFFENFARKAKLTLPEMDAGINLYNNLPSQGQERPFNLKIESKKNQICYNLKNGSNAVKNCIGKKTYS